MAKATNMSNKKCLRVSADTADDLLCEVWDMAKKLKGEVVMLINHDDAGWLDWSSNVGMIGMTGGYNSLPIFAVDDLPRGKVVVTTKKHQNKRDWSSSQAKIINVLVTSGDDW